MRNSDELKKLWRSIRANAKALAWMLTAWVVIGGLAYAASRIWWRDDLPRSLIGAGALVLCVIAALAIFGVQGPKTLVAVLAAFGAVVAVGGGTVKVDALLSDGPPQEGAVVNCPPTPSDQVRNGFVAETDLGYSLLRSEPSLSSHVLLRYPPGCQMQFTAYCIGEPKTDWRFHDPDPVWFYALGDFHNGYIPAADIRAGPPPGSLPLGQCEGGGKAPARPEITSPLKRTLKGPIEITAAAPGASEVGFAAYYEDRPGQESSAAWHQLGVDLNTGDGVSSNWTLGRSRVRAADHPRPSRSRRFRAWASTTPSPRAARSLPAYVDTWSRIAAVLLRGSCRHRAPRWRTLVRSPATTKEGDRVSVPPGLMASLLV